MLQVHCSVTFLFNDSIDVTLSRATMAMARARNERSLWQHWRGGGVYLELVVMQKRRKGKRGREGGEGG